jgi:hypothetical protein
LKLEETIADESTTFLDGFDTSQLEPVPLNEGRIKVVDRINHIASLEVLSQAMDLLKDIDDTPAWPFPLAEQLSMQDRQPVSPSASRPHASVTKRKMDPPMHELGKRQPRKVVGDDDSPSRFRIYQAEQWREKFDELCQFRDKNGHCSVPRTCKESPILASWVKRQRYQYKLKIEGKQSTMTDERFASLEQIGFIWDSHIANWEDRLVELKEYYRCNGRCNVPTSIFPSNSKLASWVKSQRRQCRLLRDRKIGSTSLALRRFSELQNMGFQ